MPRKNPNPNMWRFPDHESWVPARVNSGSRQYFMTNLKEVLQKFGLEKKFEEGPFGIYLKLAEPLTLYGQLIHNILKREIILSKGQREDEMWFGLGNSQARFGQEEFCLCSGLNMGQLPQGFANNNKVPEDSMLRRMFNGKRPTAKVLYATLRKMTSEESEDAYKMLNIYMVSQFFGMDDGRTTAIPGWLFTLVEQEEEFKNFPWGSFIFSLTFYFLKGVLNGRLLNLRGQAKKEDKKGKLQKMKNAVEEEEDLEEQEEEQEEQEEEQEDKKKKNKKKNKKLVEVKGKGKGKGKLKRVEEKSVQEKKDKKSKYYTYNLSGFPLALQVRFK